MMSQWQPLSTAPEDGYEILAGSCRVHDIEVIAWDPDPTRPDHPWGYGEDYYAHKDRFTHWMLLPDDPLERNDNGK